MFGNLNGQNVALVRMKHGMWRRGNICVARVGKDFVGCTDAVVLENSAEREHQSDNQSSVFFEKEVIPIRG